MLDLILNETVVHVTLIALAVGTPLAALLADGAMRRWLPPDQARRRLWVFAGVGPVTGALWLSYNSIIARFGLDSVAGLAINAALFVLVGVAGGLVWRRLAGPAETADSE